MSRTASTVILLLVLVQLTFMGWNQVVSTAQSTGTDLLIDLLLLGSMLAIGYGGVERVLGREDESPALEIGLALLMCTIVTMELTFPR